MILDGCSMGKSSRPKVIAQAARIDERRSETLKRPDASRFPKKKVIHLLLVTVIALLAYSNTFHSPFQFDDIEQIVRNHSITDINNFISNTKDHNFPPSRFVGYLTFALNYEIGALNVRGYHIWNLIIHIANAFLVYLLLLMTFRTPAMRQSTDSSSTHAFIGLFAALLFVSHPLQTQAVTYIVQRLTSLATLFYLLSLVMYIKANLTQKRLKAGLVFYPLSFLSAVCAMKTKEIAFTLPATVVLYEFMFFKSPARKRFLFLLPIILTLVIIPLSLLHSDKPLGEILSDVSEKTRVDTNISRWDYLMTEMRVITTYLRLIFVPINQNLDYNYRIYESLFTPPVLLSFLLLLSIAGSAFYLIYVSARRDNASPHAAYYRLISFGIFWFFITLSVESSIIPIVDVIFEHRVYLPSVGLFIAIIVGIVAGTKVLKAEKVALPLLILSIVLFSGLTYARNTVWMTGISLWEDVVTKSPNKARPHYNLAVGYYDGGRLDEALREFQAALRLNPKYIDAHNNLGVLYSKQGRLDEALNEFQTVVKLSPDFAMGRYNVGTVYGKQGRLDEALNEFQAALRLNPKYIEAHNQIGMLYSNQGRPDEALREFQAALRLNPKYIEAHNNLGVLYSNQGRLDEALSEFQTVVRLSPDFARGHYSVGTVYVKQGRLNDALREFQATLRLDPNHAGARRNLEFLSGMTRGKQ
jgi:protein O-mannosyl-transferase